MQGARSYGAAPIIRHSNFVVRHSSMASTAIILAAGKSTRMKSKRPKALHEVCGRPMLQYVLDACYDAGCTKIIVVVGYAKEQVIDYFGGDKRIQWVEQT